MAALTDGGHDRAAAGEFARASTRAHGDDARGTRVRAA
ncbi:hypothetical protein MYA_5047 [Burkholderia sp. KJ006]|nr:hypothetical protein MYA_5047 [Burkholderia sp. KJ006]